MRRGEYPCPVEVQKAHAAFEIEAEAEDAAGCEYLG
jgi:NADH-quinone oxidoreductase subunit G